MTTKRTAKKKQELFLAALAETGNVSEACRQSTLSRRYAYKLKDDNEDFAEAWHEAEDQAGDVLEAEARRRAVDGWDEPVFYQGEQCATVRKFSDTLLIFLLKGNKPEKFKDRQSVDISGRVTFNMQFGSDPDADA